MRLVLGSTLLALVSLLLAGPADAGPGRGTSAPRSAPAVAPTAEGDPSGRVVLLLDSSGSMAEPAPGGGTKIDAAREALRQVATELPEGSQVGVRVFGATVENRSLPGACTDTQAVVPVGPLDRGALTDAVAAYRPYGETPIGNALGGGAADLGPAVEGQQRTIVLLSDGEPTCAPDPCKVARQLRGQGIDLRINVIGLDVDGKARQALQCIARAGGGRYVDAADSGDLVDSLVDVSVRAVRTFSLAGTPVTGGTSTADPAALDPGDYVDTSLPDQQPRFYVVDVPEGGGVSASVVMRPGDDGTTVDLLQVELLTLDGVTCGSGQSQDANVLGLESIIGTAASYSPATDRRSEEACAQAEQLLVQVAFRGAPTPMGVKVRAYPAIEDYASLPEPVSPDDEADWLRPVVLEGPGTPVVGGASFETAPTLEPGVTYSDTLRPREQLIYKVPVGWGQSPRFTARLETDPLANRLLGLIGIQAVSGGFNALGADLPSSFNNETGVRDTGRYTGAEPLTLTTASAPVRLRNLEPYAFDINNAAFAGDYYLTVEMGSDADPSSEEFAAPLRLAVAVDGAVTGEPTFAGEVAGEPSPSPSPSREPASSAPATDTEATVGVAVPTWLLAVGIGVVVVLAATVVLLATRRRRP